MDLDVAASGSPLHMTTSLIFPLISQLISIKGGWDLPALGCLEGIGPALELYSARQVDVATMTIRRKIPELQATHPNITWCGSGVVRMIVLAILLWPRKGG